VAKALLLYKGINNSTQIATIKTFEENFVATGEIQLGDSFSNIIMQIKDHEPTQSFAESYLKEAENFFEVVSKSRELANI